MGTQQNNDLGFFALSVKVTSGANFVTIQPWGWVIPPNVIGWSQNLPSAQQTTNFDVTAPPQGTQPVGPAVQTQTSLIYSSTVVVVPSAGLVASPQTVAVQAAFVASGVVTQIFTGLARALTLLIGTQDNANHNVLVQGTDPILSPTAPTLFSASGNNIQMAFGEGTSNLYTGTTVAATFHLWPIIGFNVDSAYFYSARLYY